MALFLQALLVGYPGAEYLHPTLHFAAMECQWPGWLTTRPAVAVGECPGSQGTGISWAADVPSSLGGGEEKERSRD